MKAASNPALLNAFASLLSSYTKPAIAALVLFAVTTVVAPDSAEAVCGKQCREARDYCNDWEAGHPGQTCGRVRGAICTGSAWDKITQVNTLWSACRLVEGSADYAAAQQRCDAFEENWGGDCQVHSPLCNAGWIRLQTFGKFRACRKIEFTGTIVDLYRAYMRKWEGLANLSIPAHLKPFIEEQYDLDPDNVRIGRVPSTDNSTCITDCNRINCDKDWVTDRVTEGYNWHVNAEGGESNLIFHELTHAEQCEREGGRDSYAILWFSNLPLGIINALVLGQKVNADNVHDLMPMEVEGNGKGWAVAENYVRGWWHKEARCRIYRSDRKLVIYTSQDPHPRAFCDLKYNWQGARFLRDKIKELSLDYGNGEYHVGFGRPDEDNGVWIGTVDVQNPVIDAALGADVSGEVCPKPVELNVVIVTDKERSVKLRYKLGNTWSGWKQVFSKPGSLVAGGSGFLAQYKATAGYHLGPGQQTIKVEIENYPRILEKEVTVTCPPFAATKVGYAVRVGSGDLCPRQIDELVNFETNGPGIVRFGFREKGKGELDLSPDYVAPTERSGNKYVASFQRTAMQPDEIALERRVETLGTDLIFSDWKPIAVECLEILDSAIIYDGPDAATCDYKTDVRLRINADMESDLPYRLDCADGQQHEGSFAIRQTAPGSFIGVDTLKLDVEKTGKQVCALKADLGEGLRNLTFQGKDLTCLDVLDAGLYIDGPGQGPCPAELDIRARFNARDMAAVGFGLACSNGQSWTGKLPVEQTGPGTYIGVLTRHLEVGQSGQIACVLKSHMSGAPKIVALRGKTYQCVDVAVPGASSDLTGGTPNDGAAAQDCIEPVPAAETDPVGYAQAMLSRLGFDAGPVDGRMGPRTGEAVETFQRIGELPVTGRVDEGVLQALRTYGGEAEGGQAGTACADADTETQAETVADEPSGPAIVAPEPETDPAPTISVCRNGAIRNGECVCRAGWTQRRISRFEYLCIRPVIPIGCENGTVRAGECVCRPGWRQRRAGLNRFVCERPAVRIVCDGGKVSRGQCVCPRGTTVRKRGPNRFQCVTTLPQPVICKGGVVRAGKCFCPRGAKLIRGQCVRPAG